MLIKITIEQGKMLKLQGQFYERTSEKLDEEIPYGRDALEKTSWVRSPSGLTLKEQAE